MFPVMGAFSAGLQLAGGFMQKGAIERATQERLRQMRMQAQQHIGAYQAAAGASGVEAESSTVQSHIRRMSDEYMTQMQLAQEAGNQAATNAVMGAAGSAFGSFAQNLYKQSQIDSLLGKKPEVADPPTPEEMIRKPSDAELWAWEPPTSWNPLLRK